ncbi:acyltransferase [Pontibacter sp. E15-1]|uniref:acyltransferase family protein n=1 Tax=Pontibacter sp. E15-1 TaxID=2919918 RepID=UPI001F4FADF9|nr:acyltransferase [Pontibacter sp. E15-1]MCJ8163625.1 acyltransferase [Pontibacter sp. E15-1]
MKTTLQTRSERNSFITVAKGVSIVTIVLYHYLPYVSSAGLLSRAYYIGGAGIYIFLFASGYGLYHSRVTTWASYCKKRFARVLVPYYIGITVIFLLNAHLHIYPDGWKEYLSHMLLFKMFYEPYASSFGNHFWFIATIVQFYMLWPVLLAGINRFSAAQVISASILISVGYSVVITLLGVSGVTIWFRFVLQYIWVLVLGAVVAKHGWLPALLNYSYRVYVGVVLLCLGIVLVIAGFAGEGGMLFNDYFMFLGFSAGCAVVYFISLRITLFKRLAIWVESFSYSLYILHMFVLLAYLSFRKQEHIGLAELPVVVAAALLTALLFHKLTLQLTSHSVFRRKSTDPATQVEAAESEEKVYNKLSQKSL